MGHREESLTTEHYTARVVIEKVERTVDSSTARGKRDRVIDEVTSFTMKEKDMNILIRKLGMHLEIVNRFGDDRDEENK